MSFFSKQANKFFAFDDNSTAGEAEVADVVLSEVDALFEDADDDQTFIDTERRLLGRSIVDDRSNNISKDRRLLKNESVQVDSSIVDVEDDFGDFAKPSVVFSP